MLSSNVTVGTVAGQTEAAVAQEILGKEVGRGVFGADMKIEVLNDGPVTLILDTRDKRF